MRVAVTGAGGFIGSALMPALAAAGHETTRVGRAEIALAGPYEGAEAVIHLAGLAHRTGRSAPNASEFEAVNAALPLTVYAAARAAAVRIFIHVSTIAVLSGHGGELTEDMEPAPTTEYDRAKAAAEAALLAETTGPALTIVRPPLVYGPGAKGNLRRLTWLCSLPIPLPFAGVANQRDMIGVFNLADALVFLLRHPGQGIVHVTDGDPLSLPDMVSIIRQGMMRPERMFAVPQRLLWSLLPGRMGRQLFGDQRIDASKLRALGWSAPTSHWYDLVRMGKAYGYGASKISRREY